jgi:sulfur-oxidizing protein SoxX
VRLCGAHLFAITALALAAIPAAAQEIVEDAVPASLTGTPGDAARGRAIVADRTRGLCLLCHSGPIPEERFQGNLAPSLDGAGARWSQGQLRLRIADARRLNPDTIMPSYLRQGGFNRAAPAWRGKSVLAPQEIEDVVAYLVTLREDAR